MPAFVFSPARYRYIAERRANFHARLMLPSVKVRKGVDGGVYGIWIRYVAHDEDGNPTGRKLRPAVQDAPEGEAQRIQVVLTVAFVAGQIDLYEGNYSQALAQACGYKTGSAMRTAWLAEHPRSPIARPVYFMLGDHRDPTRYLTSTRKMRGGVVGDYTANPLIAGDDLSVLAEEEYEALGMHNRQKHVRRQAEKAAALSSESLAARVARLEGAGREIRAEIRQELRDLTIRPA